MFDLFITTKNSEKTLEKTLSSINNNIPKNFINRKILIDDYSEDNTENIAKKLGWEIVKNKNGGILNAFIQCVEMSKTDWFITFEHDIILCENWIYNLIDYLTVKNLICVQGIRLPTNKYLRVLYKNKLKIHNHSPYSIDNNIWNKKLCEKTFMLCKHSKLFASDNYLRKIVNNSKLLWIVDFKTVSLHIKDDFKVEKKHFYFGMKNADCEQDIDKWSNFISHGLKNIILLLYSFIEIRDVELIKLYSYSFFETIKIKIKCNNRTKI